VLPVFVREGLAEPRAIDGMFGVEQHTETSVVRVYDDLIAAGVQSVMIFAIPELRDAEGSEAYSPDGILTRSVRRARERCGDRLVIIADLCLDEFTSHGHCGVLDEHGAVDNDATLERYGQMALRLAAAGADMLGASGMMDGQVGFVRQVLDDAGFRDVAILAYSAKYASSFYGPFRNAVESQLEGDRRGYQQDPRNRRESCREIELDVEQGADVVMVKPALSYLDVVSDAARQTSVPVAAYVVSGETAMVEAAAAAGAIDRERAIDEVITSVARAGATIICTYWALELALRWKE
jgi:porphobilinogen synthase